MRKHAKLIQKYELPTQSVSEDASQKMNEKSKRQAMGTAKRWQLLKSINPKQANRPFVPNF